MNVEKKKDGDSAVKLAVKVEPPEIAGEYRKVQDMFFREASIPGFRKGKVPRPVVMQKFGDGIKEEAKNACLRKFGQQAVKESGLEPVATPSATDVEFDPEKGMSFTVVVEVRPEFDLPKYKKLAIKGGDTTVKEEAV